MSKIKSESGCLGVFAKYWQPGTVKTRMASTMGDDWAAAWYRQMLDITLQRLSGILEKQVLYFDPVQRRNEFLLWSGDWQLQCQPNGDLGTRMHQFFLQASDESDRVLVVGSDCPHYPLDWVRQADQALQEVPVVIGPTSDGGYYLLGLRRPVPQLFPGIDWSTSQVFEQTMERVRGLKLACHVLPETYDLDQESDWRQVQLDFERSSDPLLRQFSQFHWPDDTPMMSDREH